MKLKISQLKPNPFKKNINGGELDEGTIEKIQSNMKELGLMGSLPVFKKGEKYYLIAGHHRQEALKRQFGKDFQVQVTVHNYSEENVLRGMVVENLTQRNSEFLEEKENLIMIRNWLKSNVHRMNETKVSSRGRENEGRPEETGSIRDIYSWLNKNGEVMALGKISQVLSISDNLAPELLEIVSKTHGASGKTKEEKEEVLATRVSAVLSGLKDENKKPDHKTQIIIAEKLRETNLDAITKEELVRKFKNAPEEVQEKVKSGEIDLVDMDQETSRVEMENFKKIKDKELKIESIKENINKQVNYLKYSLLDSKDNLKQSFNYLLILSKYIKEMNEDQKDNLDNILIEYEELFRNVSKLISQLRSRI